MAATDITIIYEVPSTGSTFLYDHETITVGQEDIVPSKTGLQVALDGTWIMIPRARLVLLQSETEIQPYA